MDGHRIAQLSRLLRHRAGLTQDELALRSGVKRWRVMKLEAADIDDLRVGEMDRCFAALDARLDLRAWYHGAAADRLLDEGHARLVGMCVEILRALGWTVEVEVSFSDYGDRGTIDILAWHEGTRSLLVLEVKTELGSIEGTLRPLDIKYRLATKIARERFGWQPASVSRIVVLPEDRTARRLAARHATVLKASLPAGSRDVRSWLRSPAGAIGGIWFLSNVGSANLKRNPSSIRRVRHARSSSETAV